MWRSFSFSPPFFVFSLSPLLIPIAAKVISPYLHWNHSRIEENSIAKQKLPFFFFRVFETKMTSLWHDVNHWFLRTERKRQPNYCSTNYGTFAYQSAFFLYLIYVFICVSCAAFCLFSGPKFERLRSLYRYRFHIRFAFFRFNFPFLLRFLLHFVHAICCHWHYRRMRIL